MTPPTKPSTDKTEACDMAKSIANAERAINQLQLRVTKLEEDAPSAVGSGDGKDLRPVLLRTCVMLKNLRNMLIGAGSEMDAKVKELEKVKAENGKLKYQIGHLKRSLKEKQK